MNENARVILIILIPASVTILGFILNYLITLKTIKSEIHKQKATIHQEKMATIPEKVNKINLLLLSIVNGTECNIDEFRLLLNDVLNITYSYGSKDAMKLAFYAKGVYNYYVQKYSNKIIDLDNKKYLEDMFTALQSFNLLFCQIKYDLMNICMNSKFLINSRFHRENDTVLLVSINNNIVKNLKLKNFLKIKSFNSGL